MPVEELRHNVDGARHAVTLLNWHVVTNGTPQRCEFARGAVVDRGVHCIRRRIDRCGAQFAQCCASVRVGVELRLDLVLRPLLGSLDLASERYFGP